ncbi:MauE/DoxX family redox-associated membrane protein [Sphingobacterium sp. 2149]|uniref:MauE/DoxX family redox-associated membrane protein n=1 Tax=Sphingobacterium sp. 2149 TaxID=2817763 RepID=UPI001AE95DA4|nr:MauE/DoxX family redox-associated membrane protein [Sphingobacterium sp. 2149]MDR6735403.1 putative membrane protein YphA (DoxX/SURF4 family) [Sphingobacterium sp. 2149]
MEANKTGNIVYKVIRAAMILFWVYVGMEKFWQLGAFKIALEQQPVISHLAPILFWLLPLVEIGIGVLLGILSTRLSAWGWKVSAILILVFSMYIGLGVLNVYDKKPCMCTSFLSNISWIKHLFVNLVILGLSIAGWLLHRTIVRSGERELAGKINIALFLIGFLAMGAIIYGNTNVKQTNDSWRNTPDSIYDYWQPNTASSHAKGLLASTYDRYRGPYRQLFTKSLQAGTFTNQLPACSTERRVAL